MRFVQAKSEEQQAVLSLHRVRQALITDRTALINPLRGLLAEFGMGHAAGTLLRSASDPSDLGGHRQRPAEVPCCPR